MSKTEATVIRPALTEAVELPEFIRYALVGGSAFLVDYGLFFLTKNTFLSPWGDAGVYIATAAGFIIGLIYNYLLSLSFVFRSAQAQQKGRTFGAFMLFSVIGVIGLGFTEAGMYLLFGLLSVHYLIARAVVAVAVLVWNYLARKFLIFS